MEEQREGKTRTMYQMYFFHYDTSWQESATMGQGGKPHKDIWRNSLPSPSTKNGTEVPQHSGAQKQNTSLECYMIWLPELIFQDFLKIVMTSAAQGLEFP